MLLKMCNWPSQTSGVSPYTIACYSVHCLHGVARYKAEGALTGAANGSIKKPRSEEGFFNYGVGLIYRM